MKRFFFLVVFGTLFNSAFTQVNKYKISPVSANQYISSFTNLNVAMFSHDVPAKKKLVVVLANKGDVPEDIMRFDSMAAKVGFHVIGLSYNNSPRAMDICANKEDPDCYEQFRKQIITGEITRPEISMDSNHHIVQRLKDMLLYLDTSAKQDDWGQYLDGNNNIIWNNVVVAGHAEGANNAAMMSKLFKLDRVLCFSPIPDKYGAERKLAPWPMKGGLTVSSGAYVFYQEDDTSSIDTNFFKGIGFSSYGDLTYIEDVVYPYNYTRRLTTRFISDHDHTMTLLDRHTPIEPNNEPKFRLVWGYMLTNNLFQSTSELEFEKGVVYPNPFKEKLTIDIESKGQLTWSVYSVYGLRIIEGKGKIIETKTLSPGIYLVDLQINGAHQVVKVVKK